MVDGKNIEKDSVEKVIESDQAILFKAFNDDSFLGALKSAGRNVNETGYEFGFEVRVILPHKDLSVSPIMKGSTDSMYQHELDALTEEEADHLLNEAMGTVVPLINVHYHPDNELRPSLSDFRGHSIIGGVMGIAVADKLNNVDLLLMQQIPENLQNKIGLYPENLLENLDRRMNQIVFPVVGMEIAQDLKDTVVRTINDSGVYKAVIVSVPRGAKKLPETEIQKLRDFLGVKKNATD